jgi:ligand-binding sensor domain-containing protein
MPAHPEQAGRGSCLPRRQLFATVLAACIGLAGPAGAQELTLARMNHASWDAQDGAPQGVTALAQAADGTLWIGSEGGLYHFDGRTFTAFQSPPGQPETPAERVLSLLVTRDGTLWVGFRRSALVRIARGHVTRFDSADGRAVRAVEHLREARDGSVWAAADDAVLIRFARGDTAWRQEATPPEAATDPIGGLYIDASDVLWLAQDGRMFRRQLPEATYTLAEVQADVVFGFAETPGGDVWMTDFDRRGDHGRTQRFDRQGRPLVTLAHRNAAWGLLQTPDGSLLVSLWREKMYRYDMDALTGRTTLPIGPRTDSYGGALGPTDEAPTALLLDSDRNVWVGGRRGLGRFRAPRLVPFRPDSLAGEWNICANAQGNVLVASGALFSVSGGVTRRIPGADKSSTSPAAPMA